MFGPESTGKTTLAIQLLITIKRFVLNLQGTIYKNGMKSSKF
jgi:nicotinamide riboside kinase